MEQELKEILDSYLEEIEAELGAVPRASRAEFIAEIRSHLQEEWKDRGSQTEQELLQIIHNFGSPQEIAGEYLEKFPATGHDRTSYPATWLILVLTVFIWPVGIVLAWLSPAWKMRDKIIATLIPIIIILILVLSSLAVYTSRLEFQETGHSQIQEKGFILEMPDQHKKLERFPRDRR